MIEQANVEKKIAEIAGRVWTPVELVRLNGQVVQLALARGEYPWHRHENDEMFYVIRGRLMVQLREPREDIFLKMGRWR